MRANPRTAAAVTQEIARLDPDLAARVQTDRMRCDAAGRCAHRLAQRHRRRAMPPHCGNRSRRCWRLPGCCERDASDQGDSRWRLTWNWPNWRTPPANTDSNAPRGARELEAVYDIPVTVSAVLGKATMQVSQLLKLGRGAVVELDRKLGEAIDIYVNNRLVARGEVVMVDDSRLGVTMTEIVKTDRAN